MVLWILGRCSSSWDRRGGASGGTFSPDYELTPVSGCTTLLKMIAGEMNGIYLDSSSELNYKGVSPAEMHSRFRGEAIYNAETDVHFPKLTVGQTLS